MLLKVMGLWTQNNKGGAYVDINFSTGTENKFLGARTGSGARMGAIGLKHAALHR